MGLLNIAGGAAQGYVRGDQDIQRRREFEAMQNQRKRVEQQQKLDDEIAANMKQVRPAGTYEDMVPQGHEAATDFVGPVGEASGAKKVKTVRKPSDVAREQASVIGRGGRLQDIQAQGVLNAQAYAADAADRAERDAKNREALMRAGQMISMGNHNGAVRFMAQHANQMPELEGRQFAVEDRNGVPHLAIAENGRYVEQPRPITPQVAQEMFDKGVGMLSPELSMQSKKLGIDERQAVAHETTAKAAADKVAYDTTGPGGQAHLKYLQAQGIYLDRHGRALLMQAQAKVAADKKLTPAEKAKELTDFYAPIIQQANPGMPPEQVRIKAAQVAMRDPNAKDTRMTAIAGTEYMTDGKKIFKPGADGELEEVMLPDDLKQFAVDLGTTLEKNKKTKPGDKPALGITPPARPGLAQVVQQREDAKPKRERELSDEFYPAP